MSRDLGYLLHDPDVPNVIRDAADMGVDTPEPAKYAADIDRLADACSDWYALERLCRGTEPIYVFSIALEIVQRADYQELEPWLRDVAAAIRKLHGVAPGDARFDASDEGPDHAQVGMVGRWL